MALNVWPENGLKELRQILVFQAGIVCQKINQVRIFDGKFNLYVYMNLFMIIMLYVICYDYYVI